MKRLFKTPFLALLLAAFLHTPAKAQESFIDSIHAMLVDLNEQVHYTPIKDFISHITPFATGSTMNDSLQVGLAKLLSDDYLYMGGLLQPVCPCLHRKYHLFAKRILSGIIESTTGSEKDEALINIISIRILCDALISGGLDPENIKPLLYNFKPGSSFLETKRLFWYANILANPSATDSSAHYFELSLAKNPCSNTEEKIFYAKTLFFLSDNYRSLNKADSTVLLLAQALDIYKAVYGESSNLYAAALLMIGDRYIYLAKFTEALTLFNQALTIAKNTDGEKSNLYAVLCNEIGEVYSKAGEYFKARPYLEKSLAIKEELFGKEYFDNIVSLHDVANLYKTFGLYDEAFELLYRSAAITQKLFTEFGPTYHYDLHAIADVLVLKGDYEKAMPLYQKALIIQNRSTKINFFYPRTLHSIACLYAKLGQYEKAKQLFTETLALKEKFYGGKANPEYLLSLNSFAETCEISGDIQTAIQLQQQAIVLDRSFSKANNQNSLNGSTVQAKILFNMAAVFFRQGLYKKAFDTCTKALQMQAFFTGENNADVAYCHNLLGDIQFRTKHFNAALLSYKKAFDINAKIISPVHPDYVKGLCNLALAYWQTGGLHKAISLFMQADSLALQHIEQCFNYLSEEEKIIYLHTYERQFQYLPSILYKYKLTDTTIINRVLGNAIALKSIVLFQQQQILQNTRNQKDSIVNNLYKEWKINKALIGRQLLLTSEKRASVFDSLVNATDLIEKKLSAASGVFKNNISQSSKSIRDIQLRLKEKETAFEFIRFQLYGNGVWTDSVLYAALVIKPGHTNTSFAVLCEEKKLKSKLAFSDNGGQASLNYLYPPEDAATGASKNLYKLIWQPIAGFITNDSVIYLSPAGLLFKVAYAAVHDEKNKYLGNRFNLYNLLSSKRIINNTERETGTCSASLWGNINYNNISVPGNIPAQENSSGNSFIKHENINSRKTDCLNEYWPLLPAAKKEIDTIGQIFSKKNIEVVFTEDNIATEDEFLKQDGNAPCIIHIATHGYYKPVVRKMISEAGMDDRYFIQTQMLDCGLVLAGANHSKTCISNSGEGYDGILTAYEISQLDLSKTKLVTLSACETALGNIDNTEGVMGLQRAFSMAGVKNILMSLWKVPDETTVEFMAFFYKELMKGNDCYTALYYARKCMQQRHPAYFWAGFILTGP